MTGAPRNWRRRLARRARQEPTQPKPKASEPDRYALVAGHVVDLVPDGDGLRDAVSALLRREFGGRS